jgi:hypothetical protein
MYVDFLDDSKMISLAFEDQRHFIGILALKCSGVLDQSSAPETLSRVIAQRLWIDHAMISDVKKRLIGAQLIDDSWQPLAWDKRQRKSDVDATGKQRQQRFRERNALCNGEVTETDKNRREEKIVEIELPEWLPKELLDDFKSHRKTLKSPMTERSIKIFIREVTKLKEQGYDPVECIETAILNGWKSVYAPKTLPTPSRNDEWITK